MMLSHFDELRRDNTNEAEAPSTSAALGLVWFDPGTAWERLQRPTQEPLLLLPHQQGALQRGGTFVPLLAPPTTPVPPPPSAWLHLGSHPADGGHVITGADKVPSVVLQLEVAQPLADGLCVLHHRRTDFRQLPSPWKQVPVKGLTFPSSSCCGRTNCWEKLGSAGLCTATVEHRDPPAAAPTLPTQALHTPTPDEKVPAGRSDAALTSTWPPPTAGGAV